MKKNIVVIITGFENITIELDDTNSPKTCASFLTSLPSPSNTDMKFMKGNPIPWIIYSGLTKEMKAYLLDSEIIQIPIK